MGVLSKDSINRWIIPHLSIGSRGKKPKVETWQIIAAIMHKLKTGCQWRELPTKEFFSDYRLSWQGVYYHFSRWLADGSIRKVWVELLKGQRKLQDLSSVQLAGSQTICKNGGECNGYQCRKAANTCNSLFLADNKGLMLACSCPVAGQHHDLFDIKQVFEEICEWLQEASIETNGLFLNADAGFDSQLFRRQWAERKIEVTLPLILGMGN